MHKPKWCLFFDFHTMPACPDVGAGFDVDRLADTFVARGVDFVVFPARCNLGMAYYDTRLGIRHPSLDYDLLGRLVDACHARDVAISAYINVGISHEEGLRHRDWTVVTPEGYAYQPPFLGHWYHNMCYNSPYADHLLGMVEEVAAGYPIDGFFFDCMNVYPCIGAECVREMKANGIEWDDEQARWEFAHQSQLRLMNRLAKAARTGNPERLLYFNGPTFADQQEAGTYLEFECLPTGGWGYEPLPAVARYARNLGKPVLNMTGRFHESWGDFGGIRTEASLEYDCIYGIANGLRPTIGDHFHPRGDLNEAVVDLTSRIYARLQTLEPWIDGARPVTDIAVITPEQAFRYTGPDTDRPRFAMYGISRLLCELKQQFDVLTPDLDFSAHRLLILADDVRLTADLAARIRRFLAAGGKVIATGRSGLDAEKDAFGLDEWGVTFMGESPHDPAYLAPLAGPLGKDMPAMPVTFYDRGAVVEPLPGTEVLAEIIAPYYNRGFDGEHAFLYLPPDRPTGEAAATRRGNLIYCTHPLCYTYYAHAQVPIKTLVRNLLRELLPEPVLQVEGMPSFARATVTRANDRTMVHLMAYVPEKRGERIEMIEEPIELRDIGVSVKADAAPALVYLAPDRQPLPFEFSDGRVRFRVPHVNGYAVAVIER